MNWRRLDRSVALVNGSTVVLIVLALFMLAALIDFVIAFRRLPVGSGELLNWLFGWGS